MITYEDFSKIEIKAGKICAAEKIPDTDKLLKLEVDFSERDESGTLRRRQIVSGIAQWFPDPAMLVDTVCMFVTNLEPRTIRGYTSEGMLFAVSTPEGEFSLLKPDACIPPGTRAK